MERKPTIFIPLIASITLRDMVATGVLRDLQRRRPDVRIVILTALPITPRVKRLFAGLEVTFERIPFVPFAKHRKLFSLKRFRSFVFALSNPDLETARVVVGTFKSGTYGEKLPIVYYLFRICDALNNPVSVRLFTWLRTALMRWEIAVTRKEDEALHALFRKYRPSAVVCHAPYARAQIPVHRTAIREKVPLIGILPSWDNVTTSGELTMRMDRLLVWSPLMRWEAQHFLKYRAEEIEVVGALQFDHYARLAPSSREEFCRRRGLDPDRPIVTYIAASELLLPKEPQHIALVERILRSEPSLARHQLFVRTFPADTTRANYAALRRAGVRVDFPANLRLKEERFLPDDAYLRGLIDTIRHSEALIMYPSTIIFDAAIFRKPVIAMAFDPSGEQDEFKSALRFFRFNHIRYVEESGATYWARSADELRAFLRGIAADGHTKEASHRRFQRKVCGTVDGKVHERVARAIIAALGPRA